MSEWPRSGDQVINAHFPSLAYLLSCKDLAFLSECQLSLIYDLLGWSHSTWMTEKLAESKLLDNYPETNVNVFF